VLLEEQDLESSVRYGDVYGMLVEYFASQDSFDKVRCLATIDRQLFKSKILSEPSVTCVGSASDKLYLVWQKVSNMFFFIYQVTFSVSRSNDSF